MTLIRKITYTFVAFILFFLLLEGIASYINTIRIVLNTRPSREESHTHHDSDLGWSNIPGISREGIYGRGRDLTINDQGFRGLKNVTLEKDSEKIRIVCSGDSFTLGYGVSDDQTWCHYLGQRDPRFETINMGQGGYGLDQVYLWYMRDGIPLKPDVQILAFIYDDVLRMNTNNYRGVHYKPTLKVSEGELSIHDTPVKKVSKLKRQIHKQMQAFNNLQFIRLAKREMQKWGILARPRRISVEKLKPIVTAVLESLDQKNKETGTRFMVIFLPVKSDYMSVFSDVFRKWMRAEAERLQIPYLDLTESIFDFDRPNDRRYLQMGHYSPEVNQFVAKKVQEMMIQHEIIST